MKISNTITKTLGIIFGVFVVVLGIYYASVNVYCQINQDKCSTYSYGANGHIFLVGK